MDCAENYYCPFHIQLAACALWAAAAVLTTPRNFGQAAHPQHSPPTFSCRLVAARPRHMGPPCYQVNWKCTIDETVDSYSTWITSRAISYLIKCCNIHMCVNIVRDCIQWLMRHRSNIFTNKIKV